MNLQQILDGKKTYLVAAIAILYVLGAHLGWWPFDDKILDALGFGGLITLRAGVRKAQGSEADVSENRRDGVSERPDTDTPTRRLPDTRLPTLAFCLLSFTLLTGCASVVSNPAADAQRIQRLSTVAELAAFTGTTYWLQSHPADRVYFAASLAALDSLLKDRNYDPQRPVPRIESRPGIAAAGRPAAA